MKRLLLLFAALSLNVSAQTDTPDPLGPNQITVPEAEQAPVVTPDAVVTPAATTTFTMGQATVFTSPDNGNGDLFLAQKTPLNQAGTVDSLSFYITAPAGQLYLAVYSDSAGIPNALLATTALFTPACSTVPCWVTQPVVTPVLLQPGTYWLAYHPSSSSLAFVKADIGGGSVFYARTFAAPPATFGQPFSTTSSQWSLYATLTPPPTGPVNGTPGAPTVGTVEYGSMTFAWDAPVLPPGSTVTVKQYKLYVSQGSGVSGCPGGGNFVTAVALTATYTHLALGMSHQGQVTAIGSDNSESACSNIATGTPK
jgi:hypothetical protein